MTVSVAHWRPAEARDVSRPPGRCCTRMDRHAGVVGVHTGHDADPVTVRQERHGGTLVVNLQDRLMKCDVIWP
jgi:hypothetical protein